MKKTAILIFLMIFAVYIAGCAQQEAVIPEQDTEQVVDTGILYIESTPRGAEVYVNGELKGTTPLQLYNMSVGVYNILFKKEGYKDFEKSAKVVVGRAEEIEAVLSPETATVKESEPKKEPAEEAAPERPKIEANKINISSFAMYFDFENKVFTEIRSEKSDLFSKKYGEYIHFTAMPGAKIGIVNIPLKSISSDDCTFSESTIAQLYIGQTLCTRTVEGNIVVLGWEKTTTELEYAQLS